MKETFSNINLETGGNITVADSNARWPLMLSAGEITPAETNGCSAPATLETATNSINIRRAAFDYDADSYGWFTFTMPSNWDGTLKVENIIWSADAGSSGDTVEWEISAVGGGDDEALDAAIGAVVSISDALTDIGYRQICGSGNSLTIAGSPSGGEEIHIRIARDVSAGTLAQPANLHGITLSYGISEFSLDSFGFRPADVTQADADALIAFYNATDGENWINNTGWLTDPVVGNWYGVTVSGGRVSELDLEGNGSTVSGDISGWTLPSSLSILHLGTTSVSGDISGWTLPSSLEYLYLFNTSLSGDISGWALPSSIEYLKLQSTSLSGDISGWTLPPSLFHLYLSNTFVSGDISGWALPSSLSRLYLSDTSLSGDISGWTLPSSLSRLFINSTSLSGDISGWTLPSSLSILLLDSTSVSGAPAFGGDDLTLCTISDSNLSQSDVDAWVAGIYVHRANFTDSAPELDIGGNNAAPSGTYQYAASPSSGKEYIYALVNDDDAEGFNTWTITYTA